MPRRCALAPLAITHLNVLFPQPSRPPLPSGQPPTRRPPRRPPPPSTPRHPPLCRHCRSFSRSLSLIPRLLTTAAVLLPRPLCLPSFRSLPAPGEAAMTRVNLPQTPDRYRRTSASLSLDVPPPLPSPYCRQLLPPSSPFSPASSPPPPPPVAVAPCNEPSTNVGAVC